MIFLELHRLSNTKSARLMRQHPVSTLTLHLSGTGSITICMINIRPSDPIVLTISMKPDYWHAADNNDTKFLIRYGRLLNLYKTNKSPNVNLNTQT